MERCKTNLGLWFLVDFISSYIAGLLPILQETHFVDSQTWILGIVACFCYSQDDSSNEQPYVSPMLAFFLNTCLDRYNRIKTTYCPNQTFIPLFIHTTFPLHCPSQSFILNEMHLFFCNFFSIIHHDYALTTIIALACTSFVTFVLLALWLREGFKVLHSEFSVLFAGTLKGGFGAIKIAKRVTVEEHIEDELRA